MIRPHFCTIVLGAVLLAVGCHATRVLAPAPPLRAASAAPYAVDLEFGEPVDSVSAVQVSHYALRSVDPSGAPLALESAELVDHDFGRVIELTVPDWVSAPPDSAEIEVTATGVIGIDGVSTGTRVARFRTGLAYHSSIRALLASHCDRCHGGAEAQGLYRTDSYVALFGAGTNSTANVIAGDPNCLLLRKCRPGNSMFDKGSLSGLDYQILLHWIVLYRAPL